MNDEYLRKKYLERFNSLQDERNLVIEDLKKDSELFSKQTKIVQNTGIILEDLDQKFKEKTGLNDVDVAFLFLAVGLQLVRQYVLTSFPERLDHDVAAENCKGHRDTSSNRHHRLYNPSLEEILSSPVPFDANIGANGALCGGGYMGHRVTAIGHDPILGLIFGTANIATSTLTNSSFQSFHIYTNENHRDYFKNNARTDLVLKYTADKLFNQGITGKQIVVCSLLLEIEHLQSDLYSKNSLPLPFVSGINPMLATNLAKYGFDMANLVNVGKQASYASLINMIISILHGLCFDGDSEMDRKLHEVKTRKILSLSNLIATSSNIIGVACTELLAVSTGNIKLAKDGLKYLDVGGFIVTLHRLISDKKFIRDIKEEFIFGEYKRIFETGDFY